MADSKDKHERRIFVTGATGALGSWFVKELLLAGYRVVALTRGRSEEQARQRISRILSFFALQSLADRIAVVQGGLPADIRDADVLSALDGCSAILHCAACTSFDAADESVSRAINVHGVQRILGWAERTGTPVVHVSTAYVAGNHRGVMTETDLHVGQGFNNTYERTKYEAEELVQAWSERNRVPVTVLRPSIVVGDSVHGAITSFKTIYICLRILDNARMFLRKSNAAGRHGGRIVRFVGDEEATINLVPADYCARVGLRIIERGQPGTYHITNPAPPRIAQIAEYVAGPAFGLQKQWARLRLVSPRDFTNRPSTALESLVQTVLGTFSPYLCGEPTFRRAHTDAALSETPIPFPVLDGPFFWRLVQYARSVHWKSWLGQRSVRPATHGMGDEI